MLPEWDALHIRADDDGQLVTIVEIISPNNKLDRLEMQDYRYRRSRLVRDGIQVVEMDLTRSVKRLLEDVLTSSLPYHVGVFLPGQAPRVVGIEFGAALPLRAEALPVDLQFTYAQAYQDAAIAGQLQADGRYTEADLPFPTLLSEEQRRTALAAVEDWQTQLQRLRAVE